MRILPFALFLSANTVRTVLTVGAVALVALVAVAGFAVGAASTLAAQGVRGLCQTEDGPSCVWIAPVQGNHRGRPVIIVNGPNR